MKKSTAPATARASRAPRPRPRNQVPRGRYSGGSSGAPCSSRASAERGSRSMGTRGRSHWGQRLASRSSKSSRQKGQARRRAMGGAAHDRGSRSPGHGAAAYGPPDTVGRQGRARWVSVRAPMTGASLSRGAQLCDLDEESPHLAQALTHPSFAHENKGVEDNQRLEFLGDAILDFCASELLFERLQRADEGTL